MGFGSGPWETVGPRPIVSISVAGRDNHFSKLTCSIAGPGENTVLHASAGLSLCSSQLEQGHHCFSDDDDTRICACQLCIILVHVALLWQKTVAMAVLSAAL